MDYYLVRAVRATLTSAEGKPCIDQMPIPASGNDMSACEAFVKQIDHDYPELIDTFDFDSGFCSKHNADIVDQLGYGYVFSLKDNQETLFEEAQRFLRPRLEENVEAETLERRNGTFIRRSLVRTTDIAGYHGWQHLRQAWLVRQEKAAAARRRRGAPRTSQIKPEVAWQSLDE